MSGKNSKSSVSLFRSTSEVNAVSWSQDQRIAVTAAQTIYVMTLKRPQSSSKVVAAASSSPPLSPDPQIYAPLLIVNTAHAPLREKLSPLNLGDVAQGSLSNFPRAAKWNVMDFVDPLLASNRDAASQSHDLFKASYWSPAGYSHLGGCVLTTLTASGRLLMFTPPGNTSNSWKMALDITAHHCALLWPQATPKTTKSGKVADSAATNGGGVASPEGPRPKRARLGSKTGISDEYRLRRLSVACTAGAWLPTLLLVNCEVIGVIAVATRTGHVALLGVKLPIVLGKMKEDPVSLICDYQLPLRREGEGQESGWGCSLCWLPSSTVSLATPTFYMSPGQEGCVHAQLVVGCTNGQVFRLKWTLSGVGVVGVMKSSVSSLNGITGVCSISGVSGVTGSVSETTPLWEESDGVSVYCMASQPMFPGDSHLWVVFSKSNLLIARCLDSTYHVVEGVGPVKIVGHHKITVSGVTAFSSSSFVSSALDGTLQTFSLDSTVSGDHVTPTPVAVDTQGKGRGMRAQGVAVSEMGVFAAVSMNVPENLKSLTPKKLRPKAQLHFLTISSLSQVEAIIKSDASSKWDVCEYVRKEYIQKNVLLPLVKDLVLQMSKGRTISTPKLQLLLQANSISAEKEAVAQCRESIIHKHLIASLKNWLDWDKRTTDTPTPDGDTQSHFCVQLMVQWLLSRAGHLTVTETKLANRVLATLPPCPSTQLNPKTSNGSSSRQKPPPSSPLSPIPEMCEACGEPVPLTNLQQDSCPNGHTWSRCSLTLCLAVDTRCSSCIQCGAIVNNALTITMETGSWLNCLLQQHTCCIFCGGYFEQVI